MTTYPATPEYDIFLGIDTCKSNYSFTVKDRTTMNRSKTIPSSPEQMYNYIQNQFAGKRVICAYEAGPTGFGLYDYMAARQQPCLVVSPLAIPKAANQKVKNNRIDSEKIAEELKAGKLHSIHIPEGAYRELRHLVALRENYVRQAKTAQQRIKALLLYTGLNELIKDDQKCWSMRYINTLKNLSSTPAVRHRLDMLLMDLNYARTQLLSVIKEIKALCKSDTEVERFRGYIQSVSGIGFITAVSVLGRIGDPAGLNNVRGIAGFTGLAPTEHSTGDNVNRGSITHLGDRALRSLLIEAAWRAIRVDTELAQFYHRIKNRHHPSIGPRKAIVAVARKLTQRIYRVLKDQRPYIVR